MKWPLIKHSMISKNLSIFGICAFLVICVIGTHVSAQTEKWRCAVDLVFSSENNVSEIDYVIRLQIKNNTGRNISGVSIIYEDSAQNVVGNTHLQCETALGLIKPGSYGECSRTIQKVDESYINLIGKEQWTEIVNSQLKKLNSVHYCHVLGFFY